MDDTAVLALLQQVSQEALLVVAGESASGGQRDFRCTWANRAVATLMGAPEGSLVGRSLLQVLPDGGQLYELLVRAEQTGHVLEGETDVRPLVAPVTRIGYRLMPAGDVIAVSLTDRSPLRDAEARERWLEQLVLGGAELSAVASAILRPVLHGDQVVDLEFEFANERAGTLLGLDPSAVRGRRASEFSSEVDGSRRFTETVGAIWRSGTPAVVELAGDGTRLSAGWLRCHVVPLGSQVVVHADDVSARRAAQQALRASEHRYRSLFETANEGIALLDIDGRFLTVNDAFASMLGKGAAQLAGVSSLSTVTADERARTYADAQAALLGEQTTQRRQVRLLRPDGSTFWCLVATTVTRGLDGSIDGFLVMALDIDEQMRSATALAESEARYRAIVEHSDVLLAMTDADGMVVYANERLVDTLGCTAADVIGRPASAFHSVDDRAQAQQDFVQLASGQAEYTYARITLTKADGVSIPAIGSAVAMRAPDGAFSGAVIVGADITVIVEQEEARRSLAAALAVAEQRERERLAADLHDGPVQTLTALSLRLGSALQSGAVDLSLIEGAEELVLGTIRELRLLLFQKSPPDFRSRTLGATLADRANNLLGSSVRVHMDDRTSGRTDERSVEALFRIAQEALVNVAKHARATTVGISLYETDRHAVVEVVDDGVGAPPGAFRKRSAGHLGVRGMLERAEQLGGRCEISSQEGEGTTVFIRLPLELPVR